MSDIVTQLLAQDKQRWDLRYGGRRFLPQRLEDGTYSPGIGHTGLPWPEGRGHDYCWDPYNCISCGCHNRGPCHAHRNLATIAGWRDEQSPGLLITEDELRVAILESELAFKLGDDASARAQAAQIFRLLSSRKGRAA